MQLRAALHAFSFSAGTAAAGLYARFGIEVLPTVLFLSSTGEVLTQPRVTDFLAPKDFLVEMRTVK